MINLILGLGVMAICLALQSVLMVLVIRHYAHFHANLEIASFSYNLLKVSSVMMVLVLGNLTQLTLWALLFYFLGEFNELSAAIYHSAVNFATLGYGDIVMSEKHRLLGPLEAINGVLMIGVSTAVLTAVFQDVIKNKLAHRK